jgi:hypothetical protein
VNSSCFLLTKSSWPERGVRALQADLKALAGAEEAGSCDTSELDLKEEEEG